MKMELELKLNLNLTFAPDVSEITTFGPEQEVEHEAWSLHWCSWSQMMEQDSNIRKCCRNSRWSFHLDPVLWLYSVWRRHHDLFRLQSILPLSPFHHDDLIDVAMNLKTFYFSIGWKWQLGVTIKNCKIWGSYWICIRGAPIYLEWLKILIKWKTRLFKDKVVNLNRNHCNTFPSAESNSTPYHSDMSSTKSTDPINLMIPLHPLLLTTSFTQTLSPIFSSVFSAIASMAEWNLALTCDTST